MRRFLFTFIALTVAFIVQAQSYTYRYWFDNDDASMKSGSGGGEILLDIDASKLNRHQIHALRMQVKNSNGVWSSVATRFFLRAGQDINATGRYWLDNDYANAKTAPTVKGTFELDLTGLKTGLHAVSYQTYASDGTPSSVQTQFFLLTDYENRRLTCQVWFDDDEENAVTYPVTGEDIQLKISHLSVGMHNVTVVLYDGSGFAVGRDTQPFEVEGGKDYITLNSFGLDTYSSESDLDFSNSTSLKAYIASGYDVINGTIMLNRVYKVPAGTGLIVIGTAEKTHEVKQSAISYVYANMLKGVVSAQTIPQSADGYTHFILDDGPEGHAFYQLSDEKDVNVGSVYLAIPTSVLPASGKIKMALNEGLAGDVNGDGIVSVTDAVNVIDIILQQ